MREKSWPISSGVTRARLWTVSLVPAVRDSDVPVVSEVPSVCDRDVPWETPSERPSLHPFDLPVLRESDQLRLSFFCNFPFTRPARNNIETGVHDRPSLYVLPLVRDQLLPPDVPEFTELLVPSDSETPVDDDRPWLSDCDVLSLSDRTSRMTSVSPISFQKQKREEKKITNTKKKNTKTSYGRG